MDDQSRSRPTTPGRHGAHAGIGTDPLLQSTVEAPSSGPAPWRTSSMFYVGFFGGPIAIGILGTLNARRLRADARTVAIVAASSLALLAAWVVYAMAFHEPGRPSLRLVAAGCGAVAHLVQQQVLARQTRIFDMGRREPASLWMPGIAAVVASVIVSSVLLVLLDAPQL